MATSPDVKIDLNLAFPKAGVVFNIQVNPPQDGSNDHVHSFHLSVTDSSGKRRVPFNLDASPQLADWVRGYARWLRRAGVTASSDEDSVRGSFDGGLTPEQVLQGVRDACDMIRQRFEHYEESVLA